MNQSNIFLTTFLAMICAVLLFRFIGEIEKQSPILGILILGIIVIGTLALWLWKGGKNE